MFRSASFSASSSYSQNHPTIPVENFLAMVAAAGECVNPDL